jgi:proline iminopeptidase
MRERPVRVEISGGALAGHRGGDGPPALLLHGGPAVPDYMDGCARELDGLFHSVHYTQRGTPPSGGARPFTIESHMADALAVLDACGLEQVWVVGHSWGAHLALHLLVRHPERLLGVIGIGSLGADGAIFEEFGANLRRGLAPDRVARLDEVEEQRRAGRATEADLLERFAILWPQFFANPDNWPGFPDRVGVACSAGTNASIGDHFERGTLVRGLPAADHPVLLVHGELDPLPIASATATAELIPGAIVEPIPGCGHFPWLEQPGSVRAAVERFLP